MTLPAAILAAGASTRMGAPKALLDHGDGRTFLAACCDALRAGGAGPLFVVVGEPHGAAVAEAARAAGASCVVNPDPSRGQASSMALALEAMRPSPVGLVALVDQPALSAQVVRTLLAAAVLEPDAVHVPVHGGARGHPVAVPTALAGALRALPPDGTAREVLATRPCREHEAGDAGILLDVDTKEELARWEALR